jgi:hypothetical protein
MDPKSGLKLMTEEILHFVPSVWDGNKIVLLVARRADGPVPVPVPVPIN